jgi:hypothetical protein
MLRTLEPELGASHAGYSSLEKGDRSMTMAMHVVWDFTLEPQQSNAELFHATGERLMQELLKLEELNGYVADPAVSSEADRGGIVVELVTSGPDYATALQRALDVVRTAIHAAGGATPGWPNAGDLGSQETDLEFRTGNMNASPVDAHEMVDA